MAKIKLTQAAVDKVKAPDPSGKQTLFWDSELKGFAVLASGVTNSKSYIVQRDICGGRQRRMTVGDARTIALKEARDLAASMLHDLRHGIDPKRRKAQEPTLRATLNEFLESRQKLRPASVVSYRWGIQKYCAPWLDRPLREITGDMVEARHRAIAAEVAKDRKPKGKQSDGQAKSAFSGESTANSAMRTFRILWNFAADRAADRGIDPLPSNPVRRLNKQWFEEKRREGIVREEDMSRFYHAILALKNPVHSAYLRLLLFTGLRRTEAATLKWEDIDLHKKVIRIPANRTKAGRALALPMSDYVFDLLNEWGAGPRDKFVFPASSKAGHIAEPKHPLDLVAAATGIQITVHDLRRTFVTVAGQSNISPLALKGLVNHAIGGGDVTEGYNQMTAE